MLVNRSYFRFVVCPLSFPHSVEPSLLPSLSLQPLSLFPLSENQKLDLVEYSEMKKNENFREK